ncbi:MAG: putative DNA binding domain-containing protein [Myxococcales bacterium]|nr:putative DNA binding domain-containing protein [Myxococcales bacterium]
MAEGQNLDYKSLRLVSGSKADWHELARDCVCFANGSGGRLHIGVEDDATRPDAAQRVDPTLLDRIRKRIKELTVNVEVVPELQTDPHTGGEFIVLTIARAIGVASTSDGRYFIRIGDDCKPVVGDEVLRLVNERPSTPWETMRSHGTLRDDATPAAVSALASALRGSERVKSSVKEKSDGELLEHYGITNAGQLTNLGVLLVGTQPARARLGTFPIIQAIKYDDAGKKVDKKVWDDYGLSPIDLLSAVWNEVPDFRESYEFPDGLYRASLPAFEQVVIRELLVNALVHRPYTQRGDIFLNLHPDRLELVNPGRLPLGVTPENILHTSRRRNDGLARVFHDLGLMEREGSGIDLMYERLLASGRPAPTITEGTDSVHVVVRRNVIAPGVIGLLADADNRFQLTQRERITLGLLGQTEGLSAKELARELEIQTGELEAWTGRLSKLGLIEQTGRTTATRYFVPPALLRRAGLDGKTTLARIEPYRVKQLILEDLQRYPDSSRPDIHRRIGEEIPLATVRRALKELTQGGEVTGEGVKRWRTYRIS